MMKEPQMTPTETLVRRLYRLGGVQRAIARHALAEVGSQGFTALAVIAVNGPLRVSEVARHLSVDLSVASRQVAALEKEGHVTRQPDPTDGRAQVVELTSDGRKVLRESHRRMVHAFERVLGNWSDEDILALGDGLERLRADYDGLASAPENRNEKEPA